MSYNMNPSQPNIPQPRHPHQPRGGRSRDMKPPYQSRAPTGTGALMHTPPPSTLFAAGGKMPQHRVLLSSQQVPQQYILQAQPPVGGGMMRANTGAGLFMQPQISMYPTFQAQQQAAQLQYPTQQPIALGQGQMGQQPGMGMAQHGAVRQMMPPPVVFSPQDQPDPMVGQRPKATKTRSHAIKIVDPDTKTEVKVDDTPATEFKNKVQSVAEATAASTEEVVGEALHRPNAIITNPSKTDGEGVAVAKKVEPSVEGGKAEEVSVGVAIGANETKSINEETGPKEVASKEEVPEGGATKEVQADTASKGLAPPVAPEENNGGDSVGTEDLAANSTSSLPSSASEKETVPVVSVPVPEVLEAGEGEAGEAPKRPSEETGQHENVEEGNLVKSSTELEACEMEGEGERSKVEEAGVEEGSIGENEAVEKSNTTVESVASTLESVSGIESDPSSAGGLESESGSATKIEPVGATEVAEQQPATELGPGKDRELEPEPVDGLESVPIAAKEINGLKSGSGVELETGVLVNNIGVANVVGHPVIADTLVPHPAVPTTKNDKPKREHSKPKSKTPPPPKSGPDGRTMYGREFLMQFRLMDVCLEKPKGLEHLDLFQEFRDYPRLLTGSNYKSRGTGPRRGSEPKRIAHQPTIEKVELNKAEVRWTRPAERLGEVPADVVQTEELYRKFQGILNKLTPQKFQALAEQALKLDITTEERLSGCIDKIFTKALEEPSFSIAYANLCKVMSPIKVDCSLEEGKTRTTNFRRMLLTKCQHEFEKDKKDDETMESMQAAIEQAETEEKRQELQEELSVAMVRMRKRSLGNIRFIGELFKLKMLSETIMHECITRLLKSTSDEEALECFGKLIMTTGKDLDKPEAKQRIDAYFKRIAEIIKKAKIPARIKFLLQDVQDMRENNWVPRVRQDKQLKTIDQIHAEAKIEEEKEKEMIQQHQVINYGRPMGGGGRDGRRGGKEEWQASGKAGDRSKENVREKFDQNKVVGILSRHRKEKTGTQGSLAPNAMLRPSGSGWGKKGGPATTTSAPADKSSKPSRSSSSGTKRLGPEGRNTSSGSRSGTSGPKRTHTTPDQEKEAALQKVSQFTNPQPPVKDAPAQAVRVDRKPVEAPVTSAPPADEGLIKRKAVSIIDELVTNSDFKEAVECVRQLSPHMDIVVSEGINHTLEKNVEYRTATGKLFLKLVQEKVLTQQKFLAGLNEVLEFAEDMAIDIPMIWKYLGEVLAPVMSQSTVSLSQLESVPPSLVESGMAAKLVAEVLVQSRKVLGSEDAVKALWSQSRLSWDALGKKEEDLGEFLVRQGLGYLCAEGGAEGSEPPYVEELQRLFSSDSTNEDVSAWIKGKCLEVGAPLFMRNVTRAAAHATVTGSGDNAIFNRDLFEKRMEIVKDLVRDDGVEVLYGIQVTVTQLSHPPKLLDEMFNILYNNEVLGEVDFQNWYHHGTENFGRGNAIASAKPFMNWLLMEAEDAQNQT